MPATRHLVGLIGLATLLGACTAAPAALPIAVYTEDEALPFVAVDEAGTVIAFHAEPVSGAPTGLTIFTADDRVGHLEIDPATGHPAFWEADGYVVTFSNVRAELGLVDLGVIAPDGSTGQALDFELP
ncbi:MAG: hypothetical protein K8H88_12430, partial [Sandaracinaceae bacterium]|nr:hypothetical protein [Sandaracinaceae bacterium]